MKFRLLLWDSRRLSHAAFLGARHTKPFSELTLEQAESLFASEDKKARELVSKHLKTQKRASECLSASPPDSKKPVKLILDTDLGSTPNDALAILMALNLGEEVQLLGITTTFGPVGVRQAVGQEIVKAARATLNTPKIPVFSGPNRIVWAKSNPHLTKLEGAGVISEETIEELKQDPHSLNPEGDPCSAVEWIVESAAMHPGLTIVSIGGMTNIYWALQKNPDLDVRIVFMGMGILNHDQPIPEQLEEGKVYECTHSSPYVRQDIGAAAHVFRSGLAIQCVGHHAVGKLWFQDWQQDGIISRLRQKAGTPLHSIIGGMLDLYLIQRSSCFCRPEEKGLCPFDSLTLSEAVFPGRFVKYAQGYLVFNSDGHSSFIPSVEGPHWVGTHLINPRLWLVYFAKCLENREVCLEATQMLLNGTLESEIPQDLPVTRIIEASACSIPPQNET